MKKLETPLPHIRMGMSEEEYAELANLLVFYPAEVHARAEGADDEYLLDTEELEEMTAQIAALRSKLRRCSLKELRSMSQELLSHPALLASMSADQVEVCHAM